MLFKVKLLMRNVELMLIITNKIICTFSKMFYYVKDIFDINKILTANHIEKTIILIDNIKYFKAKYDMNFISISKNFKTRV